MQAFSICRAALEDMNPRGVIRRIERLALEREDPIRLLSRNGCQVTQHFDELQTVTRL